jgi:hypothetical protein
MLELVARFLIIGALAFGGGQAALPLVGRLAVADTGWPHPGSVCDRRGAVTASRSFTLFLDEPSGGTKAANPQHFYLNNIGGQD